MPCTGGPGECPPNYGQSNDYSLRRQIERLEAMLCALIKVGGLEKMLANADWEAAGVGAADLKAWWEQHQDKDRRMNKAREVIIARDQRRAAALAKLTDDEKRDLGLL